MGYEFEKYIFFSCKFRQKDTLTSRLYPPIFFFKITRHVESDLTTQCQHRRKRDRITEVEKKFYRLTIILSPVSQQRLYVGGDTIKDQ